MHTQQRTMDERKRVENEKETSEAAAKEQSHTIRERIEDAGKKATDVVGEVAHNRAAQLGLGVAAAAGAGLLFVQMVGVGAAAVAGAAGYLAYRELSGKHRSST